jgi:hypothetical protein
LLIRRLLTDPTKKVSYIVFGPVGTTLAEMVEAISARWKIEEDCAPLRHENSPLGVRDHWSKMV